MIDMSKLYTHKDYPAALNKFNSSKKAKKWAEFKDIHLTLTNHKCPICECSLKDDELLTRFSGSNNTSITKISATIDHYRPQKYYNFLKLTPENYILMCSECNNIYKGCEFPLFGASTERAKNCAEIINERPLIVNPIIDKLLNLFVLVLRQMENGRKVLELAPKHENGYFYEQAKTSIKLFKIGECDINDHSNENVRNLRINLLHNLSLIHI
ncbi:hypothetical protein C7Y70_10035, partial [Pseudoalteromonas sp. KS88]